MATTPLPASLTRPRFGRPERTEIRADFARDVLADMKTAYLADDRLEIHPVSDFIKSVVDRSGAVVVVLGARKSESDTRAPTSPPDRGCARCANEHLADCATKRV